MGALALSAKRGARWRAPSATDLVWESWNAEYSLFDRRTGETHIIGMLPGELLRLLEDGPRSTLELAHLLAELCEVEDTPQWSSRIGNMLTDLEALELVETCEG